MQHVYGHAGNLGNECADHAAALGSLGFISSQNVATHWVHHNFDTSASCEGCNSISEIIEILHRIRAEATARIQDFPLDVISKSFQVLVTVTKKLESKVQPVIGLRFNFICF